MLAAFTFAAALLHTSGTARVARCCPPAAAVLPATEYMLRQLQPAQSIGLLAAWEKASRDLRAAGFRGPQDEAIGERALKLKQLAETLPRVKSTAMILGLCEKGSLSFETLEEPHKSQAETLSRTSLRGEPPWGSPRGHPHLAFGIAHRAGGSAISAGRGSAIAFVSQWEDHVVVNPQYLELGEAAEAVLLADIAQRARAAGVADVRLHPAYQADGAAFYERGSAAAVRQRI
ncbi:hypothetical protein EMIHUDRAFT_211218 [Emiliania huxleyi CCMP1516]|uniref:Uncharacterized protein n=2 Tax=Emiliania huxleyi TaxID=2903 RepID=A0A0D3IWM8_EMIH1|nr:hypothetical protein EMIHUDRAFT_211218 [Emiliania huxleyi CCMP1516]EOD15663.1 hypothetical protein EMIHUDRAFT_211218 [Emiliania huxleyi CCMP1516]|eukprot:XP_005768092.1 hypothetical protein EMIHUDRAFT_211218 [Emiliania huxleyi CCMP1516]